MIGRVYRGAKVGGLIRYLYGPGRHNEHLNPHLVGSWRGTDRTGLDLVEPPAGDVRPLIDSLELPLSLRTDGGGDRVAWHCPLRTAPRDRRLSDKEWGDIAVDLMHRTGIAPRGDVAACRWIAVRHDEDSVHVAAVLVRQDGVLARTPNDWRRVRETCLAAEAKYGLHVTAPADVTAARHTSRPEVERAARRGLPPARDWLRTEVRLVAASSFDQVEFFDRLGTAGIALHPRTNGAGYVTGYAVGRPEVGGNLILFGGGKLAADLSLPRLRHRWTNIALGGGQTGERLDHATPVGTDRQLLDRVTRAAEVAADEVLTLVDVDPTSAGDAASAALDALLTASRAVEGNLGGPISLAAAAYDRAARDSRARTPTSTPAGAALRVASAQLARTAHGRGGSEPARVALLAAQLARLVASVEHLRYLQQRTAQAAAARHAGESLLLASAGWTATAIRDGAALRQANAELTPSIPPSQLLAGSSELAARARHRGR